MVVVVEKSMYYIDNGFENVLCINEFYRIMLFVYIVIIIIFIEFFIGIELSIVVLGKNMESM